MQNELKRNTISGTIWKFAERIAAQGVSLIVSIILARILTPNDYGVVGIVAIFFSFVNVLISGGLNSALIQKKDADKYDYSIVLLFSLLLSVIIYLLIFIGAPFISDIYQKSELTTIFRIMGLILPVMAIKSVLCAFISANLQFKKFFFSTIVGTVISAIVGIIMAANGFGAWALVAQQMTNTIIDTSILALVSKIPFSRKIKKERFKGLFGYGSRILVSSLIDTAFLELNPLFIGLKYTSADLSYYTKGKSFPGTISNSITNTLSAVFFPLLSKVQSEKERVLKCLRLFMKGSSFLAFPMMLGFLAISDSFIKVLLTEKWMEASFYIKMFCLTSMFDMIASGNCQVIKAIGRADIFLKIEVLKKVGYFVIIGLFMLFTNTPEMLAISMVVCTIVSILINTFPNTKLVGYSYKMQIFDMLPNLVLAIIMAIVVYVVGFLPIHMGLLLVMQIIVGIIVYLLLAIITRNSSLKYLLQLLQSIYTKK